MVYIETEPPNIAHKLGSGHITSSANGSRTWTEMMLDEGTRTASSKLAKEVIRHGCSATRRCELALWSRKEVEIPERRGQGG